MSVQAYDNAGNASAMAAAKYTVPVDDTHFAYAPGWSSVAAPSAYGASFHYSAHTGTVRVYDGAARTYVLWVLTGPYGGRVNVYVGSTLVKVIDLYSSVTRFRVPVTVYSSSLATRMLKFLVTGVKDSALTPPRSIWTASSRSSESRPWPGAAGTAGYVRVSHS